MDVHSLVPFPWIMPIPGFFSLTNPCTAHQLDGDNVPEGWHHAFVGLGRSWSPTWGHQLRNPKPHVNVLGIGWQISQRPPDVMHLSVQLSMQI